MRDVLNCRAIEYNFIEESRNRTYLAQKPGDQIPEHDGLVRLMIVRRSRDTRQVPQVAFPFVQLPVCRAGVEQDDLWRTLDEPAAIEHLDALLAHGVERELNGRILGLLGLDFHGRRLVGQGSN